MRISELSQRSGVPVGTIKFYLRERLLPPGETTSPTQARYDESHVERLRLIRTLLTVGGLSVARTKTVLAVVDDPNASVPAALDVAHAVLAGETDVPDLKQVRKQVEGWGWTVRPDSVALADLARGLEAARIAGVAPSDDSLDRYAKAVAKLGRKKVAKDAADAVLGAVLLEPVLLAMRRLSQEDSALHRFARA